MKIKNRQEFLVILACVAAGLFVGINFVLAPLADWWRTRSTQITALRNQVAEGQRLLKYDADIRRQWREMQANALPANTSQAEQSVLQAFESWRGSGAEITSITPQWNNDATNYMTLGCRVEASGDILALTQLLYQVEKGPLPLRVDTVELNAHDTSGQQLTMNLEVNGLALMQKDKP